MLFAVAVLVATPPSLTVTRGPGASGCSDTVSLTAAVRERAPHGAEVSADAARFAVAFAKSGTGFTASIERRDSAGERIGVRQLTAADCDALGEAVALTVSMALANPDTPREAAASTQPSSHAASETSGPAQVVRYQVAAAAVPHARETAPHAWPRPHLQLSAGSGVAINAIPHAAATTQLSLIVRGEGWSVSGGAQGLLPADTAMGGGAVRSWLITGDVAACAHYHWVAACGAVIAGALTSAGRGLANARTVTTPWLALAPGVAAQTPFFYSLALRARAELIVPLTQTTVRVGDAATWTSAPLGGLFALDLVADIL